MKNECYCCKEVKEVKLICVNYADSQIPFSECELVDKRLICNDCNHTGEKGE